MVRRALSGRSTFQQGTAGTSPSAARAFSGHFRVVMHRCFERGVQAVGTLVGRFRVVQDPAFPRCRVPGFRQGRRAIQTRRCVRKLVLGLGLEQVVGCCDWRVGSDECGTEDHRKGAPERERKQESRRRILAGGGEGAGARDRRVEERAEAEAGEDGGHRGAAPRRSEALAGRLQRGRQSGAAPYARRDLAHRERGDSDAGVHPVLASLVQDGESGIPEEEAQRREREDGFRSAGVDERAQQRPAEVHAGVPGAGDDVQSEGRQVQAAAELREVRAHAARSI